LKLKGGDAGGECVGVMKVVESCGWVYMDGSEAHGSSSVTVITKYGRHTRFTFFEVWAPHVPVDVILSDTVLEQVKGWKVPARPESRYCIRCTSHCKL